ncbi:MAG: hypothetical protein NC177_03305 [Ruminococcus flavefaciens]|nr:hypothetical protein [Ruminococcus flavefaciens]
MKKIINKPKISIISDLKFKTKSAVIYILSIISSVAVITAMITSVYNSQENKHEEMQKTIVTASEQLMEMTIESGVAIAKSIYTNENIYSFLNDEYDSSGEYYDAFYSLQHSNPLTIAETNIINNCIVYTENPTILTGGNISSFTPVLNTDWYHEYKKLNKPMILYIDKETNVVSIIRRLDFQNLKTGESCLKLDLNMKLLTDYCDSLDFNGKLYIINGGSLIYSNIPDITLENTDINPDFECYIKNYYTADIEYYAYEYRKPIEEFFSENIVCIIIFVAVIILMITAGQLFTADMKRRIRRATEVLINENSLNLTDNGKDEIGELLDMCIKFSEKLAKTHSVYRRKKEEVIQTSSQYNELFATAMKLDAELYISEKYPDIYRKYPENIPLETETEHIRRITHNITCSGTSDMKVPAYSLFLIAEDLYSSDLSVSIVHNKNTTNITFTSSAVQEQPKILKLNAIFEDSNISDEYSFSHKNPYNPYLRIMHCLENRVSAEIKTKDKFTLCITIKSEMSD